jgi:hypothetical protein
VISGPICANKTSLPRIRTCGKAVRWMRLFKIFRANRIKMFHVKHFGRVARQRLPASYTRRVLTLFIHEAGRLYLEVGRPLRSQLHSRRAFHKFPLS